MPDGCSDLPGFCESSLAVLKGEILARKRRNDKESVKLVARRVALPKKLKEVRTLNEAPSSDEFDASRRALEAKAKLYDKLCGDVDGLLLPPPPLHEDNPFMVDFERKFELGRSRYVGLKVRGNYVEYVDQLGRTRSCTRAEFECAEGLNAPKKVEESVIEHREEVINDMINAEEEYREKLRQKWADEVDRVANSRNVHYEHVRSDEIRELGVGYYSFSKDEDERNEQLKLLAQLREETVRQREHAVLEAIKSKVEVCQSIQTFESGFNDRIKRIQRNRGIIVEESKSIEQTVSRCVEQLLDGVEMIMSIRSEGTVRVADEVVHRTKNSSSTNPFLSEFTSDSFTDRLRNKRISAYAPHYDKWKSP